MSDDYIRVLFFRNYYEEAKEFWRKVEEKMKAQKELNETSGQRGNEECGKNEIENNKFEANLIEIELQVEICCAITKDNKKETE